MSVMNSLAEQQVLRTADAGRVGGEDRRRVEAHDGLDLVGGRPDPAGQVAGADGARAARLAVTRADRRHLVGGHADGLGELAPALAVAVVGEVWRRGARRRGSGQHHQHHQRGPSDHVPVPPPASTRRYTQRGQPRIAIAALRPGMPLTPPPRRAPAPPRWTLAIAVSVPQRAGLGLVLGERPREVAVEDVAARERQLVLEVERRLGLQARLAVRARAAGSPRSARRAPSRASAGRRPAPRGDAPRARRSNSRAGVCSANSVSVWARHAGPEDARVGQRVAVDLARQRRREPAVTGLVVGGLELRRSVSLTWKVPANASSGAHGAVAQPRQPRQQHVDLQLRALRPLVRAAAGRAGGRAPPARSRPRRGRSSPRGRRSAPRRASRRRRSR